METGQVPLTRTRQPCAACRLLRRRCDKNCTLSPYFPAEEIDKFAGVHKVFGASNVIRMIQMVEETKREDAVKAIVYEAMARLRDPVYGSAGTIFHLQNMIEELKSQVQTTRAQALEIREQRDQLLTILTNRHYLDQSDYSSSTTNTVPTFHGDMSHDDGTYFAYDSSNFPLDYYNCNGAM